MILVTGATGFLGSQLLKQLLLKDGEKIRAIYRSSSDQSLMKRFSGKVEWIEADLTNLDQLEDAIQGVDKVYHCAALVSFDPKRKKELYQINVEGTQNLVNLCLAENISRFIYVSSIAAIGRDKLKKEVSEETDWTKSKRNTTYAKTKFQAEMEVWRAFAEGLNGAMVNPSVILGPWKWNEGTARFFPRIFKGQKFYPDAGGTGFVDVKDVAKAMIKLMDSTIHGERFILNAANLSYKDFFNQCADALKVSGPKYRAKSWMINLVWPLESLRSKLMGTPPMLTKETAGMSFNRYFYQNEKAIQTLDLTFAPIEETIQRTADKYLSEIAEA